MRHAESVVVWIQTTGSNPSGARQVKENKIDYCYRQADRWIAWYSARSKYKNITRDKAPLKLSHSDICSIYQALLIFKTF